MKPSRRQLVIAAFGLLMAFVLLAGCAAPAVMVEESDGVPASEATSTEAPSIPTERDPTELKAEELAASVTTGKNVVDGTDFSNQDYVTAFGSPTSTSATHPTAFDLRNATFNGASGSFVTPVKSQAPFGTCWTFGAIAAAEASYLAETGQPVVDRDRTLDLSEKQLTWFSFVPVDEDGDGQLEGLFNHYDSTAQSWGRYLTGGETAFATGLFSSWVGPLDESLDPLLGYHNAAGEYDVNGVGLASPKATGDWSLPAEWRNASSLELEESFFLPSPASYKYQDSETGDKLGYVYNQQGVDAIKDQLLAGRAVAVSFCGDITVPEQAEHGDYINLAHYAHYTDDEVWADHVACIVGYDDTYSSDNFNFGHRPPGDGAFIVKNNWGEKDGSFGNVDSWGVDGSGYFYLSYYDKSIESAEAYDFVTPFDDDLAGHQADENTVQYRHDSLPGMPAARLYEEETSAANIYAIDEACEVRTVSTVTLGTDSDVRYAIYRLGPDAASPTDGELAWSGEAHYAYGGYHRMELDPPLAVAAGERLGVVVTAMLPDGTYELVQNQFSTRLDSDARLGGPEQKTWAETEVEPGESFLGAPVDAEAADGSSGFADYVWVDLGETIAAAEVAAQPYLESFGIPALQAAVDAALPAYMETIDRVIAGTPEDDPAIQAARQPYVDAQQALSDVYWPINDDLIYAAAVAQDNFPITLTVQPTGA